MLAYLKAVQPFLGEGGLSGIRISTRPDAVPEEILCILKEYGVTAVELGAQSMSDRVLEMNQRGHTAQDVREAAVCIRRQGFSLGLQMMYGLYGSTPEEERRTLEDCIALRPDTMRLYPTVILEGTCLAERYRSGRYVLPSWEEMLDFAAMAMGRLREEGIRLIRCGLHVEQDLEKRMIAGFYHPALRELAESRLYFKAMICWMEKYAAEYRAFSQNGHGHTRYSFIVETAKGCAGKAAGHKGENRRRLCERELFQNHLSAECRMKIREVPDLAEGQLRMYMQQLVSGPDGRTIIRIGEEVYDVFKIT